jgi:UDP-glucose 4-epimerase
MDRVLVTGGGGFIGSSIAARLTESYDVVVVDNFSTGNKANVPTETTLVEGDLSNTDTYDDLDEYDIDAVLHLAGQSSGEASFDDPEYDFESHAVSTFKLLRWCESTGVSRFVYASSMSVYGDPKYQPVDESHPVDPKTYYAAGKLSAESYVKLFDNLGLDTTIFRLFSVYGPGQNLENMKQGMVSIYLSFVLNSETLTVKGPLERFRDFVYIDDVVKVWTDTIEDSATYGETYNVARCEKVTIRELIERMLEQYGDEDYPIEVADGTPGDQFGIYGDASKLRNDTGWTPSVTIDEGLGQMVSTERE